jgi:hypothetical protein
MWLTIRLFWYNHFVCHWQNWQWKRHNPHSLARIGHVTKADIERAQSWLSKV